MLIVAVAVPFIAAVAAGPASAGVAVQADIVQVIETSAFNPPSPDPSGVALRGGKIYVSDAEVEETKVWKKKNVFIVSRTGELLKTFATTRFSKEPAGLDATKKQLIFSDDDIDKIFFVRPGKDRRFGTRDDKVRSFGTRRFGCNDPEGVALGGGFLFISEGTDAKVFRLSPGRNGIFDGVGPKGDDRVRSFNTDTPALNQPNPEGIEYRPSSDTLFIVSNRQNWHVTETTIRGALVQTIEVTQNGDPLELHSPAGLAWGKASDSNAKHLYIVDRRVDNSADPDENDGILVEISF